MYELEHHTIPKNKNTLHKEVRSEHKFLSCFPFHLETQVSLWAWGSSWTLQLWLLSTHPACQVGAGDAISGLQAHKDFAGWGTSPTLKTVTVHSSHMLFFKSFQIFIYTQPNELEIRTFYPFVYVSVACFLRRRLTIVYKLQLNNMKEK